MKYEIVLGLEIHIQLNTPNKMFCWCKNDPFFSEPNTNTCPVCLGLPGAMPVPNKEAIISAQKLSVALGSKLNNKIIFERKNYFYPDLPKGFQITCPHYPIASGGRLEFRSNGKSEIIRFREIHLEEDTAKSIHEGQYTKIDFNKSGVPLLEIVTEPDFSDIESAVSYCKEVQLIARFLGVSEADMEKGNMRLEANISLRKTGEKNLPEYRVELKNINSFTFMKKALDYEVKRQSEELDKGVTLFQETRGYDESTGKTFIQRSKEEPNDYRYFPEPDIPPIIFTDVELNQIEGSMPLLPSDLRKKLVDLKVSDNYIEILISNKVIQDKFFQLVEKYNFSPNKAATLCVDYKKYFEKSAEEIYVEENAVVANKISDESTINEVVLSIIKNNPKSVEDYKNGKENAIQYLLGQVMKETKGSADPSLAKNLLITNLSR